jgi:hypothetical protein
MSIRNTLPTRQRRVIGDDMDLGRSLPMVTLDLRCDIRQGITRRLTLSLWSGRDFEVWSGLQHFSKRIGAISFAAAGFLRTAAS